MRSLNKETQKLWPFVAVLIVVGVTAFSSCTPNSGVTVAESDVVLTLFNDEVDFGAITTYRLPDTVVHLTGDPNNPDDPNISREYDREIIQRVKDNLNARGYQWVSDISNSDIEVLVSATSTSFWSLYSWGGGWNWWYGGCCWNPWYPGGGVGASYSFTTGTLIVDMVDEDEADQANKLVPLYWEAAANGVLDDTELNIVTRFRQSIDQMFIQSPYLKSNSGGGN